jgi:hypothetical protein
VPLHCAPAIPASLSIWAGVIVMRRMISYTMFA